MSTRSTRKGILARFVLLSSLAVVAGAVPAASANTPVAPTAADECDPLNDLCPPTISDIEVVSPTQPFDQYGNQGTWGPLNPLKFKVRAQDGDFCSEDVPEGEVCSYGDPDVKVSRWACEGGRVVRVTGLEATCYWPYPGKKKVTVSVTDQDAQSAGPYSEFIRLGCKWTAGQVVLPYLTGHEVSETYTKVLPNGDTVVFTYNCNTWRPLDNHTK